MSDLDKQKGTELLAEQLAIFEKALATAESIADKYGLYFIIQPTYGMGGIYVGTALAEEEGSWYSSAGWMASSQSC